ncbi:hypothetical protein QAD02_006432 [Eretmocerus hayati]|uniref:Uncharacterized protein n=1 Tax=Eretmocerus hayati TaxID=131215 RepID=A0ACC2N515_9HYME|nr:hypothetical protein QAD02_006432 [Eretmocerus hayati]
MTTNGNPIERLKDEKDRASRDIRELGSFMELMEKNLPQELNALVNEDLSVARLKGLLKDLGRQECTALFNEELQHFVNDMIIETLKSIKESIYEYQGILLGVWKQLSSGSARKFDEESIFDYPDIIKLVNGDLQYEEDSVKVLESSSIEAVRVKLSKELNERGILRDVQNCLDA